MAAMSERLSLSDHTVIKAAKQQVSCGLSGEAVILSLQNGIYYGLNTIGARIWELLQEPRTVEVLRSFIQQEFDVEPARCAQDIDALLGELSNHGLIEVRDGIPEQSPQTPTG